MTARPGPGVRYVWLCHAPHQEGKPHRERIERTGADFGGGLKFVGRQDHVCHDFGSAYHEVRITFPRPTKASPDSDFEPIRITNGRERMSSKSESSSFAIYRKSSTELKYAIAIVALASLWVSAFLTHLAWKFSDWLDDVLPGLRVCRPRPHRRNSQAGRTQDAGLTDDDVGVLLRQGPHSSKRRTTHIFGDFYLVSTTLED